MSNTNAISNAAAVAAQLAKEAVANQEFIDNADLAIADAITMGKFEVYLFSVKYMNFQDILDYYLALDYVIGMPSCQSWNRCQPSNLFGQFWVDYWGHVWHTYKCCRCKVPCQVVISWKLP